MECQVAGLPSINEAGRAGLDPFGLELENLINQKKGAAAAPGEHMAHIESDYLEKVGPQLGDAVIDPTTWPRIMDNICRAIGATGAILLQSDVRTPDVPRTWNRA